jgi:uncharacterized protein
VPVLSVELACDLEASWKAAPPAERDLWQGLAQLVVGLTHARRGNAAGAAALLRRGATRIGGYRPGAAAGLGIDSASPAAAAAGLAERIDSGGLGGLDAGALDLRLRGLDSVAAALLRVVRIRSAFRWSGGFPGRA